MIDPPIADLLLLTTTTIATTGADGEPHAAAVYFVADGDLRLYFLSDPHSQHATDIANDSRSAVTIHPECQGWQDIRGLQMRGEVRTVDPGAEWEAAWERYQAKFPFVAQLKAIVALNQLYVFTPHWMRLVDNRQGFGYKQEWLHAETSQSTNSASGRPPVTRGADNSGDDLG